jgi:hypothetical protein
MIGVGGSDWSHYEKKNPQAVKRQSEKASLIV